MLRRCCHVFCRLQQLLHGLHALCGMGIAIHPGGGQAILHRLHSAGRFAAAAFLLLLLQLGLLAVKVILELIGI